MTLPSESMKVWSSVIKLPRVARSPLVIASLNWSTVPRGVSGSVRGSTFIASRNPWIRSQASRPIVMRRGSRFALASREKEQSDARPGSVHCWFQVGEAVV
jgi:hypothetical protein